MFEESKSENASVIAETVCTLTSSGQGILTSPVVGRFGAKRSSSELKDNPFRLDHSSSILAAL